MNFDTWMTNYCYDLNTFTDNWWANEVWINCEGCKVYTMVLDWSNGYYLSVREVLQSRDVDSVPIFDVF